MSFPKDLAAAQVDWYFSYLMGHIHKTHYHVTQALESYSSLETADPDRISDLIETMTRTGHILLLPGTVYAFALRNRRWGSLLANHVKIYFANRHIVTLNLSHLQDIPEEEGWNDLILPSGHKNMVRAVVENHTAGSRSAMGIAKATREVDIVRGKGK